MNTYLPRTVCFVAALNLFAFNGMAADTQKGPEDLGNGLYFYDISGNATAQNKIVVTIHGFGVKPKLMMEPVIKHFNANGISAILVELSGHRSDASEMDFNAWRKDVRHAVEKAQEKAPDSEVVLFGHSLGGSLAVIEAALSNPPIAQKMALLAPATGLKTLTEMLGKSLKQPNMASIPCKNSFVISLLGPIVYCCDAVRNRLGYDSLLKGSGFLLCGSNACRDDLTLNSFYSLFNASDLSASEQCKKALLMPTLVVVEEKDGLVDYQRIQHLFNEKQVIVLKNTENPVLAHTFQNDRLLDLAMKKLIPFILGQTE